MPAIFLQETLEPFEIEALKVEFHHYELLHKCEGAEWNQVEVLYGNRLAIKEFHRARRLRWIHSPTTDVDSLCLNDIRERGNILISTTRNPHVSQIAEFVLAGILSFSKLFFYWSQSVNDPQEYWNSVQRENLWCLKNRILIQIGLGEIGTEIVKKANTFGLKTWGVYRKRSFHPYCHQTFSLEDLHSLLPAADIVSINIANEKKIFGEKEFDLMKSDSIFIATGHEETIDESALAHYASSGKFRGMLLDIFRTPPSKDSLLWQIPNIIITPEIASHPLSAEHLSFRIFRNNLRVFTRGKINEMKNLYLTESLL